MGRTARGVRGIELDQGDEVIAALAPHRDGELLAATERGYGKRLPFTEFKLQGRAGKGLGILPERDRVGDLIGLQEVLPGDRIMWETESGALVETTAKRARTRDRRGTSVSVAHQPEGSSRFVRIHPLRALSGGSGTEGTPGENGAPAAVEAEEGRAADRFGQAEFELSEE